MKSKQIHPPDRPRAAKHRPKTHHTYRETARTDEYHLPNALLLAKPSFQALWLNLGEVVKLLIVPGFFIAVALLCSFIANGHHDMVIRPTFQALTILSFLGVIAGSIAIGPAFGLIQLRSVRSEAVHFWDEFVAGLPLTGRYLGATLLLGVMILGGLVLFIVPGLYAIHRFYLTPYYVLDREYSIADALRASSRNAQRHTRAMRSLTGIIFVELLVSVIPVAGVFINSILQIIYGYAPAIRYVEFTEIEHDQDVR